MNRREFVTLIGAGTLCPSVIADTLALPGLPQDAPTDKNYPIYYARLGGHEIYKLWQPGIVIGVCSSLSRVLVYPNGMRHCYKAHNLHDAIVHASAYSMIIDDNFGRPYTGDWAEGDLWEHYGAKQGKRGRLWPSRTPALIPIGQAESLASRGHIRICPPFCTFEEFITKPLWEKLV